MLRRDDSGLDHIFAYVIGRDVTMGVGYGEFKIINLAALNAARIERLSVQGGIM